MHEDQGTGYDSGAAAHELVGRASQANFSGDDLIVTAVHDEHVTFEVREAGNAARLKLTRTDAYRHALFLLERLGPGAVKAFASR